MEIDEKIFLNKYYEKVKHEFFLEKKKDVKSIFIGFLEMKNNVRYKILNKAAREEDRISINTIKNLLRKSFIRGTDKLNQYTITAKGIWEVENEKNDINQEKLLDFIDKKYFNLFGNNKSLNDKEKVMLLFMIVSRSFSEKAPIDLKKSENTKNIIEQIIRKCFRLLKNNNFIKSLSEKDLLNDRGNEHPVSDFIRHKEALLRKTNGIYKTLGDQKYCLDLNPNDKFETQDLGYLLWLIFGAKMNLEIQNEIQILIESVYNKSVFIYDSKGFSFFQPKYDDEIKKSFDEYFINTSLWEEIE
jgi:predicted transcriptional regulator